MDWRERSGEDDGEGEEKWRVSVARSSDGMQSGRATVMETVGLWYLRRGRHMRQNFL